MSLHQSVTSRVVLVSVLSGTCFLATAGLHAQEKLERTGWNVEPYAEIAERIIAETRRQNDAWKKMEELCDGIGHRLSGSAELDEAIKWAVRTLKSDGQENVRMEPVMVPKWVRGRESLEMVVPRRQPLVMLGLGGSVGTPAEGITAPVIVVRDEKELESAADRAKGHIVLFNNRMADYEPETNNTGYGTAVRFRTSGAQMAAAHGAVACLVRSVTAKSLRSPHTGAMRYSESGRKIPAAAISIEDADSIARLCARGETVKLRLRMEAQMHPDAPSANVIGELRGREKPEEVVVIGGHLDSWDVGQGAHDDAAGCVMCMEAINVLRRMKLIPRRTVRVVLFTNEENGLRGGRQYAADHADEAARHVAAIETDSGGFQPRGFGVDCGDKQREEAAVRQLSQLIPLMQPLGVREIEAGHSGADVGPMREHGVLLMGLSVHGATYFDYHHSHADTLDKVNPRELSDCVAAMATMAYVLADMPARIGQTESAENLESSPGASSGK